MKYNLNNFTIYVEDDYESMSKTAACVFASELKAKPEGVFGFATGGTPVGTYSQLIEMYQRKEIDFAGITSFNLDEYYPIMKSNGQSYDFFMRDNLFNHVNINTERINIPNGEAKDISTECREYEAKIANTSGIDLQILGIGGNGHIGFNEPYDYFQAETHYVSLDTGTIQANARFFDSVAEVPKSAITMGIKTIMMAKKILLLVSGGVKSTITCETIFGKITPMVPASILQLHQNVTVVMDKDAAQDVLKKL